jgi:iron complex outermembrane receptor protein
LNDNVNLYARAATGYLGSAIQDRVTNGGRPVTALPQKTLSGEAGVKSDFFERRLNVSFDAFWARTKNLQLTAVGGASNTARLLNIDHAITAGFELELQAKPLTNLLLTAGGSYNFTEMKDPSAAVATCGSRVCTVTNALDASGRAILDGNDLPQAPRWIGDATARYSIPLSNGGEIFAYTDWTYRSGANFKLYTAKEFHGKPLLTGGLKLGYGAANGLEVAFFARNITNKVVFVGASDFNNLAGFVSEPRIVGAEVRKSF